ncbi:unnamed protein product [Adineta steineri]|uniref:Uncharacterized protein n=1 Tax=Adineta steineri TaxID=433720 RepID=A0A815JFP9_9BILA|nr:unnamed protein product [Adineta steineri]CAF4007259.1 unnamed protein product [Adineta steineri]
MAEHSTSNKKPVIALDCDGVLLDYHATFGKIYEETFGKQLSVVSPNAYHVREMYGVKFTDEEDTQFEEVWREHAWKTMPMYDGALEACVLLHEAGYELVCVSAMPAEYVEHRLENFRLHGFPIDKVIGTGYGHSDYNKNPKKQIIEDLHPIVFVDDLKRNFKDIQDVHTKFVFIDREYQNTPNSNEIIYYDVKYSSLLEFAQDFLKSEEHGRSIDWSERPAHLIPSK